MSSAQETQRAALLSMVKGGDGHTEDYIENIAPSEGGGCIYHSIDRAGREWAQYRLPLKTAEALLFISKTDL